LLKLGTITNHSFSLAFATPRCYNYFRHFELTKHTMKKGIHPKKYQTKVTDLSSGKTFVLQSTVDEITTEVTNLTHPFYTGKQKIVDVENLVKKFESKRKNINATAVADKKAKRRQRRQKTTAIKGSQKLTLKDMLKDIK